MLVDSDYQSAIQTCDQIIRRKIPNLLRLYLNPFVAQTCVALSEMTAEIWPSARTEGPRPSFLANSGEEALSGAIKLARYALNIRNQNQGAASSAPLPSVPVYLVDEGQWFGSFASAFSFASDLTVTKDTEGPCTVQFLPQVLNMTASEFISCREPDSLGSGILVLSPGYTQTQPDDAFVSAVQRFSEHPDNILIACVNRDRFAAGMRIAREKNVPSANIGPVAKIVPDIVVFDESFTMNQVPFGAFNASAALMALWRGRGMSNFHSTTFQPNTVSTMHFLKCLHQNFSSFSQQIQPLLEPMLVNHQLLLETYRQLFSPALSRLISIAGNAADDVTAFGHYVRIGNQRLFDGVGGVACSLRGHNPDTWVSEIESLDSNKDIRGEVSKRLQALTGLPHHVPAVSGGSAVEHALKLALTAQSPRKLIVVLQGGFGGKTLLALTGTSKPFYRKCLEPLYTDVVYLDPFAPDAAEQLRQIAALNPIAVIQLELVQGVGGVREIPDSLLECAENIRQQTGALLFVDEIQTGMFRTGPFIRSTSKAISPDLLTIGKGTSDMMFPFALTLYSDRVDSLLKEKCCQLPSEMHRRYSFELGYRAVLNTLRRDDTENLCSMAETAGHRFRIALMRELTGISIVREIRCYGLLIGIELNIQNSLIRRLGINMAQLYLLQMLWHPVNPILVGFCQYEPHVLKLTPPLSVTDDETDRICRTIADALRTSSLKLLLSGVSAMLRGKK